MINSRENIITQACYLLNVIEQQQGKYDEINAQIRELQGDFATIIKLIDDDIETSIINFLDAILCELPSYWLWECSKCGCITHVDGTVHIIKTIDDIREYALKFADF
jgi:hypothetical protein